MTGGGGGDNSGRDPGHPGAGGPSLVDRQPRWLESSPAPGSLALRQALDEAAGEHQQAARICDDVEQSQQAFARQRVWARVQAPWWAGKGARSRPDVRTARPGWFGAFLIGAGVMAAAAAVVFVSTGGLRQLTLPPSSPVSSPISSAPAARPNTPEVVPLPARASDRGADDRPGRTGPPPAGARGGRRAVAADGAGPGGRARRARGPGGTRALHRAPPGARAALCRPGRGLRGGGAGDGVRRGGGGRRGRGERHQRQRRGARSRIGSWPGPSGARATLVQRDPGARSAPGAQGPRTPAGRRGHGSGR